MTAIAPIADNIMNKSIILALILFLSPSISYSKLYCEISVELARKNDYQAAIDMAKQCLAQEDQDDKSKILAYRSLAWSYSGLSQYSKAVEAHEFVFDLEGTTYNDLINGGIYFKKAGRLNESLDLFIQAQIFDEEREWISMMTQYHLGWIYYELKMYEQAVEEFTKGIPSQPDFSFVYYRRGLAFHSMGRTEDAKSDFTKFSKLLLPEVIDPRSKEELINNLELLEQYNVIIPTEYIE